MSPENNVKRVGLEGEILNSQHRRVYNPYAAIPEKLTIYAQALVDTGDAVVSAGFDMVLVENSEFGSPV